jgi:FkbM family methyltransferase
MPTFLELFGGLPLREVFSDSSPVSVFDPEMSWLKLPPDHFLKYAIHAKQSSFDPVPSDPQTFHPGATFLLAQAHRIWLTLDKLRRLIPLNSEVVLLDLGAFPFSVDRCVREYLHASCRILATIVQEIPQADRDVFQGLGFELLPVNLDPRVQVENPLPGMTDHIPLPDNSVDVVLFAHVIEHLYHPIQILKESFRVLKPGGKMLLTTDHGFLLGGLLNYLNGGQFVHEPVKGTAAMAFDEWRGHVRFYTEQDLRTMLESAGGVVTDCDLQEVLYNSVPEQYFVQPQLILPRWRANILREMPALRNEILLVAEKPGGPGRLAASPLNADANRAEWESLANDYSSNRCDLAEATSLDFAFGSRLLLGRWPTERELESHRAAPPARGVDGMVDQFFNHPEFTGRPLAAKLERPGPSCIVMAENPDGLRFFFSAQDTFVGFPVAIGVFEKDVQAAMECILKPGMNCLDLGANFGFYSIRMAAVAGKGGGKVYAFEPDSFNYALLLRNCVENGLTETVICQQVACGDRDGEVNLYAHPNQSNFGGVHARRAGERPDGPQIGSAPLRRVDGLIPDSLPIHVIKMDVEGYEPFALRGLTETVERWHPVIICEFSTSALSGLENTSPQGFLDDLHAYGYAVYEASAFATGDRTPFVYNGGSAYANLVCVPGETKNSGAA